ncbi:MAG: DUF4360 domain-containing protein [Polyangiales bacterium]
MSRTNKRLNRNLLLHLTCAAMLTSAACAGEVDSDEAEARDDAASTELALQTQARDPAGSYFADVKANGTGCPPGSWQTDISKDGKTFTSTFDEFAVEVSSSKKISVKDCTLRITLHSPQGLSFAIQNFQYSGYALLGKDVKARHVATYYFQGQADDGGEASTDLVGPKDETYVFADDIATPELVWSECGKERNLNVRSTLRLQNADPATDGYFNLAAVDGRTKLSFKLAWKTCKPAADEKSEDKAEAKPATAKPATTTTKPASKPAASSGSSSSTPSVDDLWGALGDLFGGGGSGPVVIGTTRR